LRKVDFAKEKSSRVKMLYEPI